MRPAFIAAALLLLIPAPVPAITGIGGFTYDISLPAGATRDFAENVSFKGYGVEARWFRSNHRALGFSWHYNAFHQRADGTCAVDNGHVTGHQFHSVYSSPVLLTYYCQWGDTRYGRGSLWYLGLGAGAFRIEKKLEVGTGTHVSTNWHVGLCPEIGLYYGLSFGAYLNIAAKYNYAFKSGRETGQSYFCLCLGIAWAR